MIPYPHKTNHNRHNAQSRQKLVIKIHEEIMMYCVQLSKQIYFLERLAIFADTSIHITVNIVHISTKW